MREDDMLAAARRMEAEFLFKQEGFLGHAILKGQGDLYVDLAFADSQQRAEQICGLWTQDPHALAFLEYVDPTFTGMGFYTRLL